MMYLEKGTKFWIGCLCVKKASMAQALRDLSMLQVTPCPTKYVCVFSLDHMGAT